MDKKDLALIFLGTFSLLLLLGGFGSNNIGCGYYGMMSGFGFGWAGFPMLIYTVALVLLIIWFFNQVSNSNERRRR